MSKYYHPITLEHINTTNPADWMSVAETKAPDYDSKTQGCFYKNGAWVVEDVDVNATAREERKTEMLARLSAIDLESLRPLRAIAQGVATDYDSEKLATLEAEAVELRAELASL